MGYTAAFFGELAVDPPLTASEAELVEDCYDFEVDDERAVITIDVTEKPYAVVEAIRDMVNVLARGAASEIFSDATTYLTSPPTLHMFNGTIGYSGEDRGDVGKVKVTNSVVTED